MNLPYRALCALLCGTALFIAACSSDSDEAPKSTAGPLCEKYFGTCCLEWAGADEAGKKTCADAKKSFEDAIKAGGDPQAYEATCESGIKTAQSANKCK